MAGLTVRIDVEDGFAWWEPFVRWFRCIPHLIWVNVMQAWSIVLSFVIGAKVLVSGQVPAGLAAWQVTSLRERVRTYGYFFLLRQSGPPLATEARADDPGDDPLTEVSSVVPTDATRASVVKRPLTLLLHLVALGPIAIFLDILYPVWMVVLAVRKSWSPWFLRLLLRTERWVAAVVAYVTYASNDPPPFGLGAYARAGDPG